MSTSSVQLVSFSNAQYSSSSVPGAQVKSAPVEHQAAAPQDKVELSAAAQAKMLEDEGQSVAQIASNLALPTKTVESYLGITTSSETQILAAKITVSR
jgi:hypothetical protein